MRESFDGGRGPDGTAETEGVLASELEDLIQRYGISAIKNQLDQFSLSEERPEPEEEPQMNLDKLQEIIVGCQQNDPEAKNKLISEFRWIIYDVLNKSFSQQSNTDREDLYIAGVVALLRAAEKCDLGQLEKFKSYARTYIWAGIMGTLPEMLPIPVPEHIYNLLGKLNKIESRLTLENGSADPEAVRKELNLSTDKYKSLLKTREALQVSSLNDLLFAKRIIGDGGDKDDSNERWLPRGLRIVDTDPKHQPQELVLKLELSENIERLLATLTPIEERIIKLRFGFTQNEVSYTYSSIAEKEGISRERVMEIESIAIKKLKEIAKSIKTLNEIIS